MYTVESFPTKLKTRTTKLKKSENLKESKVGMPWKKGKRRKEEEEKKETNQENEKNSDNENKKTTSNKENIKTTINSYPKLTPIITNYSPKTTPVVNTVQTSTIINETENELYKQMKKDMEELRAEFRNKSTVTTEMMDEKIEKYILDIVFATRRPEDYKLEKLKPLISYGASPRGSINLGLASKAQAFLNKRGFVIPEDVRSICKDVLRHRIGLTYEAEAENVKVEEVIEEVLRAINVP